MGWTFTSKPKGQSTVDFFKERFNTPGKLEVLAGAVVNTNEVYLACRATPEGMVPYVFAVVCLLQFRPKDHYPFGYKDMDESMNPYAWNCPERIFKMLTDVPDQNEGSKKWRQLVAERIAERNNAVKLHSGTVIKLKQPVPFRGGGELDTFVCTDAKRRLFKRGSIHTAYKLRKEHLLGAVDISKSPFIVRPDETVETIAPADGKKFKLEEMQKLVDGWIQVVPLPKQGMYLICNEEGKLKRYPVNQMATRLWEVDHGYTDVIVGNALFVPVSSGMYA